MLILCSSCNSKYLVNSSDLKPEGRTVQCAKCGHNWFQTTNLDKEENLYNSASSSEEEIKKNYHKNQVVNLPSTYVKEQKPSIINTILVLISLFILGIGFWFLKNNGVNFFNLISFYIQEFFFNLKIIISDLGKIIHLILN